ncbi:MULTISPECIES: hypothetical protein [Actinomycetes]|uniref:hypothetical protein n=1 Tax=Actinomycetes TaxID=1760 RepID=UPI0004C29CD4|nr:MULTISPECIES: hypothetical protein [Actinomycetes]
MFIVAGVVLVVWALALDGLTQPEATITTGVLAIYAAGVALLGVHRQIRSNERINERNRTADHEQAKRAELLEVVRDAITQMIMLTNSLIELNNARRAHVLETEGPYWDNARHRVIEAELTASWSMLAALGQNEIAGQLAVLLDHAGECLRLNLDDETSAEQRLFQIEEWLTPYTDASARTLVAFQQLLGSEVAPSAAWNPPTSKYYMPADETHSAAGQARKPGGE